ncbi:DUF1214 domain-containing protein [Rhabdothermincola salaria]|uniref:DUF1214 domain-containing protein n=1 Tax=Rhabdothermincola salaria TaxID=2903142 RepID=UPI001E58ED49|nr:DUF1214 domain-containing protein [Rhabdothermincola salaria]MCD9623908.1 DUF1214 domain-containing protein [Rhabdothermincola salaria]
MTSPHPAPGASALPSWADQMALLDHVGDHLVDLWRPDGATEAERQDMYGLALSILSGGYLCRVYTDARRPVFMPLWNYAYNQGGPDPDYVYSTTEIDATGVYELSGRRGTSRFVEITQMGYDIMSPTSVVEAGPASATHDLDDLALGPDGSFRVVLSPERPAGHDGDWWELNPGTVRLLMRKCACDWNAEVDAQVAINRLDDGGADTDAWDMTPEDRARRFSELADWVTGMIEFDMDLVRWYREHHGVNHIARSTKIDTLGGLPTQAYYDAIHEIDDDEALILDTALPRESRYWQALVADDRFATVDWVNRQSSLNDAQARVDTDGRFRAVISRRDPGVPNWLDKGNLPWGVIQMRVNRGSDYPDPMLIKVPFAEVRDHLPADTPVVTPDERRHQLRLRREGAQLRRIW